MQQGHTKLMHVLARVRASTTMGTVRGHESGRASFLSACVWGSCSVNLISQDVANSIEPVSRVYSPVGPWPVVTSEGRIIGRQEL